MKCDELQRYSLDVDYEEQAFAVPDDEGNYMESSDVIEAIAELKAALDKEKAWSETLSKNGVTMSQDIEQLKAALESEKAIRYAEGVDAEMRERSLKRVLYRALEIMMRNKAAALFAFHLPARAAKFKKAIDKCRAKTEKFGG